MSDTYAPDPDHRAPHLDDEAALAVVLGRAGPPERRHARTCESCRTRVAEWSATRAAAVVVDARAARPVPGELVSRVLAAVEESATDVGWRPSSQVQPAPELRWHHLAYRLRWMGQLVGAQVPLLRRAFLSGTALLFSIGVLIVVAARSGWAAEVLAALAPLLAIAGLAMIHDPDRDAGAAEVVLASGTSPRLVLLARLVLVVSFDLAAALAATGLTRLVASGSLFGDLVVSWFGPMLLFSSVSLALAAVTRPAIGLGVALALWTVVRWSIAAPPIPALSLPRFSLGWLTDSAESLTRTSLPTVIIALTLVAFAVAVAPRHLRVLT